MFGWGCESGGGAAWPVILLISCKDVIECEHSGNSCVKKRILSLLWLHKENRVRLPREIILFEDMGTKCFSIIVIYILQVRIYKNEDLGFMESPVI